MTKIKDPFQSLCDLCSKEDSTSEEILYYIHQGAIPSLQYSYPLRLACHFANIDVIKTLLTDDKIIKKPNIYALDSAAFEALTTSNRDYYQQKEILYFLIFEYNLDYEKIKGCIFNRDGSIKDNSAICNLRLESSIRIQN